jgi:uncharacterized membrane protein
MRGPFYTNSAVALGCSDPSGNLKAARVALGLFFVAAGTLHFVFPAFYRAIVPHYLPAPSTLVTVTGIAETVGGVGMLVPRLRRPAGVGLIVLLIALLPANVEMLQLYRARGGAWWGELLLWLRLPVQAILIWWVWRLSRHPG